MQDNLQQSNASAHNGLHEANTFGDANGPASAPEHIRAGAPAAPLEHARAGAPAAPPEHARAGALPSVADKSNGPQRPWPLIGRRGISSFWLKLIAIVAMTCDHAGLMFYAHLPFEAQCVLIGLGGITFPVMAFLLVEGYHHTSNVGAYALRLTVFALVAQAPFWLFLGHEGNVLFSLLAGLVMLWALDNLADNLLRLVVGLGALLASALCDWGVIGPAMILVFHRWYGTRTGVCAGALLPAVFGGSGMCSTMISRVTSSGSWVDLPFLLYYAFGNLAAIPLLLLYNGQRGKHPLKWFFYIYYPAHILVLGLIHLAVFNTMPTIMIG